MARFVGVVAVLAALSPLSAYAFGARCSSVERASAAAGAASAKAPFSPTKTDGIPVYNGPLVPNLKVALLGDTGDKTENARNREVLLQARARGVEAIFHAGDASYTNRAGSFHDDITEVLGADFPYFLSLGNHEQTTWYIPGGHAERLLERMTLNNATSYCTGEIGVDQVCNYKGIVVALSGVGSRRTPAEGGVFLDEAFAAYPSIWRLAVWHKNQRLYQTGSSINEVGWDVFESSLKHGAIVLTGHQHSYERTFTMNSFVNFEIASTDNDVTTGPGQSFVVVSGIGGHGIRGWVDNLNENPWWAACAASDNAVSDGALYCTFNYNGDPRTAYCEFVDRTERVWDTFFIYSNNTDASGNATAAAVQLPARKAGTKDLHEVSIARSEDDVHIDLATGIANAGAAQLPLGGGDGRIQTRLTFYGVPVAQAHAMGEVHLQVLGAARSSASPPSMVIRAALPQGLTTAAVVWDKDEEDFDLNTQWTSPDLQPLLAEFAERISVAGSAPTTTVTLVIEGGATGMVAYSFDYDACLAPTLTYEL